MEVAAAHLDERAEAAIEGTAARSLDHIHLPPHQRVSLQNASIAVRRTDLLIVKPVRRTAWVVHPVLAISIRKPRNSLDPGSLFDRAQQFTEGNLPFAAHKVVDAHVLISLGCKAGIVSTHHNLHPRPQRT